MAAAARQQRGAFVVAFMVVAGTAISSDLLKKIKEFLPDNGGGHGRCERNGGCCGVLLLCLGGGGGGGWCVLLMKQGWECAHNILPICNRDLQGS